jgi:hypothetical protein
MMTYAAVGANRSSEFGAAIGTRFFVATQNPRSAAQILREARSWAVGPVTGGSEICYETNVTPLRVSDRDKS